MKCLRCGLTMSTSNEPFVCSDCHDFSQIILMVYEDIEDKIRSMEMIDPENTPIFRLLADSVFITAQNPQTRIFYKLCECLVEKAVQDESEISEEELNRKIRTTRSWSDIFKIFEELDLVEVRLEKYRRVLVLKDKLRKFAKQYFTDRPVTEQLTMRLAHIYAGYILLYILTKIAQITNHEDIRELPYSQRPQTLWVVLMYLWSRAFHDHDAFSSEGFRRFVSRRRIPSTTRGQVIRSLQTIDGKTVQGLIKEWDFDGDQLMFHFDDYVMVEMSRLRDRMRERER